MKRKITLWLTLISIFVAWPAFGDRLQVVPESKVESSIEVGDTDQELMTHVKIEKDLTLKSEVISGDVMVRCATPTASKMASADDFVGEWIQLNTSVFDGVRYSPSIAVTRNGEKYLITGLYLEGSQVEATYNATSGCLEIAPQKVYTHSVYGACSLNSFSVINGKIYVNDSAPITMNIGENGELVMSPWGMFVAEGSYKGSAFDAFIESKSGHPNGTFKSTPFTSETDAIDARVWISQTNDGLVTVANMLGNSRPLDIMLGPGNEAYIVSQYVMSASLYGDFYLFAADASTGKINKNSYITVTPAEGGYNIGPWGVYCLASTSIYAAWGKESQLVTDFVAVHPQAGNNPMSGSGTQSDPWVVKSVADLRYIALSTTAVNNYAGTYFRLGADIDFSGFSERWFPIGGTSSAPFEGTFKGDGYKIMNLKQDFSGQFGGGIFGFTGKQSSISNVTVENIEFTGCGKYLGGLAGYVQGAVSGCRVSGTIDATNNEIGGVVAYSTAPISDCEFHGNLYGGIDMGGIVGYTTSTITDCSTVANIYLSKHVPYLTTSTHAIGGITGAVYGLTTRISGCTASGIVADLKATEHAGGIAGYAYGTTFSECLSDMQVVSYATSAVDGASPAAGGIVGYLSKGVVENCIVAGAVNAAGTRFAGGICGYGGGASTYMGDFKNCIVTGMVNTASEESSFGVTGSWFAKAPITITNCYYDCQTTGLDTVATGYMYTSELTGGKLPEGFSEEIWAAEDGFYPGLKRFDGKDAAMLAKVAPRLAGEETIRKVTKDFNYSVGGRVKWGILTADGYVVSSTAGMIVADGSVKLNPVYASETLIAYLPDGSYKPYTIKVTPKVFDGSGTQEDPFLINNVKDLLILQNAVNVAGQGHKGDYFRLTADLDLGSTPEFVGIAATGSAALSFNGTFDGGGHSIKNFKVEAAVKGIDGALASQRSYAGFFGICSKYSTIRNLTIDSSCSFVLYRYSAPVVGYTAGRVENCINYAPVCSWGVYNGGVVGLAATPTAEIARCANFGEITAADGFVGGIAGVNYGAISQSINVGIIRIEADAAVSNVASCAYSGGITGANYGDIYECENNGPVHGVKSVGGIAGGNSSQSGAGSITDCLNTAMIYGDTEQGNVFAVIGELASATNIEGNIYDVQLMPAGATNKGDGGGSRGMRSFELIQLLTIRPQMSNAWTATNGYPVPVAFINNDDVRGAAAVMLQCEESDLISGMESPAILKGDNTVWSVAGDTRISVANGKLLFALGSEDEVAGVVIADTPYGKRRYDVRAVKPVFAGAGTNADPHIIATAADMVKLSAAVNEKGRGFAYHVFSITGDLDFTGVDYVPAGSLETPFMGELKGNSHVIKNLKLVRDADYTGVFGYASSTSKITALRIDSTCTISGKAFVGAFGGRIDGALTDCENQAAITSSGNYCGGMAGYIAEGATVDKCENTGLVTGGGSYIGGLAGVLYGNATECHNYAAVNGKTTYVGGLAGALRSVLDRCRNHATVTSVSGGNYIGGLAASVEAGSAMYGCVNHGDVKGGKSYVGGLFGGCPTLAGSMRADGAFVDSCFNYGAVEASVSNVGGLAGLIASGHHFTRSINYGDVTSTGGSTIGGIAGETRGDASYTTTIENCVNYGKILASASGKKDVGGLIGKLAAYSTITGSGNLGDVTSKGYMTGGIVGDLLGCIYDSYNVGDVTGATYANGGIIGYGGTSTVVERCVNGGKVTATETSTNSYGTAAGIAGYGYSVITDCANFGDVYGSKIVGGIAGSRFTGLDIIRSYNAGKISVAEGVTSIGNIFGSSVKFTGPVWYDFDVNGALPADHSSQEGLSSNSLMDLDAGDNWIRLRGSYPLPTSISESAAARFAAGRYYLASGDVDNVSEDFEVASHPEFEWESSAPAVISVKNGIARVGKANHVPVTLTLKWNGRSKVFNFIVNRSENTIDPTIGNNVVSTEYYDLRGVRCKEAPKGEICIQRTIYRDGTVKVCRIIVR